MHLQQIRRRRKAFTLATKDLAPEPLDLLVQISDGECLSAVNSSTLNEAMFVGVLGSMENARGMRAFYLNVECNGYINAELFS